MSEKKEKIKNGESIVIDNVTVLNNISLKEKEEVKEEKPVEENNKEEKTNEQPIIPDVAIKNEMPIPDFTATPSVDIPIPDINNEAPNIDMGSIGSFTNSYESPVVNGYYDNELDSVEKIEQFRKEEIERVNKLCDKLIKNQNNYDRLENWRKTLQERLFDLNNSNGSNIPRI